MIKRTDIGVTMEIAMKVYNPGSEDEHVKKETPYGYRLFTPTELHEIIRYALNQLDAYQEVGLVTDAEIVKLNAAEDEHFAEWLIEIRRRVTK